jgi:predicted TIM-barrel fold metal-dependent hydrolase
MSETTARESRAPTGIGNASAVTGWTDCDLDLSLCSNTGALAQLGIKRAVASRLSRLSLSPEPEPTPVATRFVIDAPQALDATMLRDLHQQGVRGVRFTMAEDNADASAQFENILRYADRLAAFDWHVELALGPNCASLANNEWTLTRFPVAICFSGLVDMASHRTAADPEIEFMLAMLHMGRTWIKLSGIKLSGLASIHDSLVNDQLAACIAAAISVRPDRIVWGSGRAATTTNAPDTAHIEGALAVLQQWIPDDTAREAVLVANPARLYGFSS